MNKSHAGTPGTLSELLARIEGMIPDATQGLPEEVFLFISRVTPLVNVDLLIRDDGGKTLLTWRADEFYGPGWHVPGGIVRYQEPIAERIRAVAQGELGTEVDFAEEPLAIHEIIHAPGTSRSHFISLLFPCILRRPPQAALRYRGGSARPGEWAWHEKCPDDIIKQHEIYRKYITNCWSPISQQEQGNCR